MGLSANGLAAPALPDTGKIRYEFENVPRSSKLLHSSRSTRSGQAISEKLWSEKSINRENTPKSPPYRSSKLVANAPAAASEDYNRTEHQSSCFTSNNCQTSRTPSYSNARKESNCRDDSMLRDQKQPFSHDMLVEGLQQLGRTAEGLSVAYLKLSITQSSLDTADPISAFCHLQTLVLSNNNLTSIRSLGSLPHLTHLNVSHNQLQEVLDITPPTINLRIANYAYNNICQIRDLKAFSQLQELRLGNNRVEYVTGFKSLSMLRVLCLRSNQLLSCMGLQDVVSLRELDLSSNKLSSLIPLLSLTNLQSLDVSHNHLVDCQGLEGLRGLRRLNLSHNKLAHLEEMTPVRHAALLSTLCCTDNPFQKAMANRLHMVYMLPQLTHLNDQPIDAKQKVLAANMHGADAEGLRAIRMKYFPNGELDDGGGAIPPPEAGFLVSRAEEEAATAADGVSLEQHSLQLQAIAGTVDLSMAMSGGVVGIAEQLSKHVESQRDLAHLCWCWVIQNVQPPRGNSWQVDVPLLGCSLEEEETALLGGVEGTWAERASWLFVQLARALELEANMISGFWRNGGLLPHQRLHAHNHCWSAVKVNGRWRLVDCTCAAQLGGRVPFYTAPEAFIQQYLPLSAHWQLITDPISQEQFWELPLYHTAFFTNGLQLLTQDLRAVNHLPICRNEQQWPHMTVQIAAPEGVSLNVDMGDTNRKPATCSGNSPLQQLSFKQVSAESKSSTDQRELNSNRFVHHLWIAFPCPGHWVIHVSAFKDVSFPDLHIEGVATPVQLHVREQEAVLSFEVVIPSEPCEAADGKATSNVLDVPYMPQTTPAFHRLRAQLVEPPPTTQFEADRLYHFDILVPHAEQVAVGTHETGWQSLAADQQRPGRFVGEVQMARVSQCELVCSVMDDPAWEPLLVFAVKEQQQHIIKLEMSEEDAHMVDEASMLPASNVKELFRSFDLNNDGRVTRKEMLIAMRKNRQYADILRFPARVRAGDGTFEKFNERFLLVNTDKLGAFTPRDLSGFMRSLQSTVAQISVAGKSDERRMSLVDN